MQSYSSSWDGQFPVSRKDGEKWKFGSQTRSLSGRREGMKGREGVGGIHRRPVFFAVRRFNKSSAGLHQRGNKLWMAF